MQYQKDKYKSILKLWTAWIYSTGPLILLLLLSLWVRTLYIPFVALGLELALFTCVRINRNKPEPGCYLLPFIVTRILFWSAMVMFLINGLHMRWLEHHIFDPSAGNADYPYITILVLGPLATLISYVCLYRQKKLSFCLDCKMRHGTPAERGYLGILFTQEGQFQNSFLGLISLAITVVAWGYYFIAYDNSYFSRHDEFFYVIVPVTLWTLSAIYLGVRYIGIWAYYRQRSDEHQMQNGLTTTLRYMLIWDNYVGLLEPSEDPDSVISVRTVYDTPTLIQIRYRQKVSYDDFHHYFSALTHIDHADIRFLYSTLVGNPEGNLFHYIVYLTDSEKEEIDKRYKRVKWCTLREVSELINNKEMAPLFSAEFIRLYTIAMAWKTYTAEGKRRYLIRNYVPTFCIRDIKNWDVDYNDIRWLDIARNNQDVPMYGLRRFWRKYVSGASD